MRLLTRIRSRFDLLRAGSAFARGDLALAYAAYRELADIFDGSTRVMILNRLGMLSYALGDKQAAKGWYEQAIAIEPAEPGLYMNLANALDDLGEYPAARAAYEQALARSRRPDLLYNFGVFIAKSDPHRAARLLRESLDDQDAMRKFELPAQLPLDNLVALGEHEELFDEISRYLSELESRLIGLEPWSMTSQHANLLSHSGRHDQALARFEEVLEKWPNASRHVRYDLGMALVRAGRWERAREEFARVVHPMSHFGLAQICENTGPASEAVREYGLFLKEMREVGHDPIVLRADAHANLIARAEAYIAAHSDSRDDGASQA